MKLAASLPDIGDVPTTSSGISGDTVGLRPRASDISNNRSSTCPGLGVNFDRPNRVTPGREKNTEFVPRVEALALANPGEPCPFG